MTTYDIINVIAAGGLLGILGQGIRMAIGLKKHSDANAQKPSGEADPVDTGRLMISIFIGFIAGALFLLIRGTDSLKDKEFIFSVIAAGYSGTDFIEGLFNTYIAKINPKATDTVAVNPNTAAAAALPASATAAPAQELPVNTMTAADRNDETSTNL